MLYKVNWDDLQDLSITYNNLGKTYKQRGDYDLAFYNFLEALKLMEQDDNLIGQGYYLNNLGTLFDDQQNYTKAIEYYNRAFEVKKITKDSSGMASTSFNIGISYYGLNNFDQALVYFYQSYNSSSYQKLANKKVRALTSIGKTLIVMGQFKESKKELHKGLSQIDNVDEQIVKSNLYSALSEAYLSLNQIDSAKYFNQIAYTNIINTGAPLETQNILLIGAKIFEANDQIDSSLYMLKQGQTYYDSLVSEATINAVAEMESKYNTEKNLRLIKEAELEAAETNEVLKEKKLQTSYLIIALILVFTAAIFILIKYRSKQRSVKLIQGQKVLIERQNQQLNTINSSLSSELGTLKLDIKEKDNILDNVFSKSKSQDLPPELLDLSKREKEVLANLALGLSDDQLAEKLFVSKSTIKTHLRRIYSKLLVKNRAQSVAIAHKHGIIGAL